MTAVHLTSSELVSLRQLRETSRDDQILRRADALLSVGAGEPVSAVARRQHVSRQTLYTWIHRLRAWNGANPLVQHLADRPHGRRSAPKTNAATGALQRLLRSSPQQYGYHAQSWSVPLLYHHLREQEALQISAMTLRRSLRLLGIARFAHERGSHDEQV